MRENLTIGFIGNPNCGKTTLFNAYTGANLKVANWPGVTVEKKEGKLKGHKDVTIMDLPGIYSLSPYTLEEVVSRDYILNDNPDVIIADEPTASLDADNARIIMRELRQINTENNSMVVVATHDNRILSPKDNILSLESDVNIR